MRSSDLKKGQIVSLASNVRSFYWNPPGSKEWKSSSAVSYRPKQLLPKGTLLRCVSKDGGRYGSAEFEVITQGILLSSYNRVCDLPMASVIPGKNGMPTDREIKANAVKSDIEKLAKKIVGLEADLAKAKHKKVILEAKASALDKYKSDEEELKALISAGDIEELAKRVQLI